jgi:hypothetical protein
MKVVARVLFAAAVVVLIWTGVRRMMERVPYNSGLYVVPFPERPRDVVAVEDAKERQRRVIEIVDGLATLEHSERGQLAAGDQRSIRYSVSQTEPIAREFDALVSALLHDERGRFIAGSDRRLLQFAEIFEWQHPSADEVRQLERDADVLIADVRRAYQDTSDARVPPPGLTEGLEELRAQAESRERLYRQSLARLRFVVEQARLDGRRSGVNLREAIERTRNRVGERAAAQILGR